MTDAEKVEFFADLALVMTNRWESGSWSWWCPCAPGGKGCETREEALQDFVEWTRFMVKRKRSKGDKFMPQPEVPMKCEYTLEATALCPADNKPDVYTVTVRSGRTIEVEAILKEAADLGKTPMFQEAFTQELHRRLAAEVETLGFHSGVKTRVVCG